MHPPLASSRRCLVIGAVNIDLIGKVPHFPPLDGAVHLADTAVTPGGHAGNCATALARLDLHPRLLASIGRDAFADLVADALAAAGVDVTFIERTDASTGLVFIPVLPDGNKVLYMDRRANDRLTTARLAEAAEGCPLVAIFDPPSHLLPELGRALADRRVVFAPGGLAAALRQDGLGHIADCVQFLVVNAPESHLLSGIDSPRDAAAALARRWDLEVVVTAGAAGCWVATRDGRLTSCASFPVDVIDTTGAGDAFVAGFCAGLLDGDSPLGAARAGCAVGALATRAMGAQSALPGRAEVDALLAAAPAHGPAAAFASRAPALARSADGWRGVTGRDFSIEAVGDLAAAAASAIRERLDAGPTLVAHDGRAQSAEAAREAVRVLSAADLSAVFAGQLPTPLATFAVQHRGFAAALLVTASHNPSHWNGVKLKVAPGLPPSADLERAIEAHRRDRIRHDAFRHGHASPLARELSSTALSEDFIDAMLKHVCVDTIRAARPRVVVDGLHGVAGCLLAELLTRAGCDTIAVGTNVDSCFGGLVPDPMHAASRTRVSNAMREASADIGFVLDGDGDRLGVVDGAGRFVWPHDAAALLIRRADRAHSHPGALAVTVATGSLPCRVARALGRRCVETPVGFKHIAPLLASGEAWMGAGGVGDLGWRFAGFDRNPFLAALLLAQTFAEAHAPLDVLIEALHDVYGHTVYEEERFDVAGHTSASLEEAGLRALRAAGLNGTHPAVERTDGVKLRFGALDSLLLRAGTTEPVVRACIESSSSEALQAVTRALRAQMTTGATHDC